MPCSLDYSTFLQHIGRFSYVWKWLKQGGWARCKPYVAILWQWCAGWNLQRGRYVSSLDELDKFYLPVLSVCSLTTTSLKQFCCSIIVLRSFYRVFYCASTEPQWFFFFLKLLAGLRFSVHQQSEMDTSVKFDLQIRRYGNVWVCTSPGR